MFIVRWLYIIKKKCVEYILKGQMNAQVDWEEEESTWDLIIIICLKYDLDKWGEYQ